MTCIKNNDITATMQKIDNVEKLKTLNHTKRLHYRNVTCSSHCKPIIKEKDEMKHIIEVTNNANKKDYDIVNQHHNEAPN